MLSHQLDTPLGAIRWNAELLRTGQMTKPLDAEQAEMVGEIIAGAVRMDQLITDVHNCSKLAQDKFTDKQAVSLAAVVSTVSEECGKDITAKHLAYTAAIDQAVPPMTASPSMLSVLVQNLLSNAIKYTPDGGTLTVTLRPATAEEIARAATKTATGLFLSVADNGYGIPADEQDKVFSKFFRAENVSNLGIDGTGLGLYIVATAVAKLGGGVWFESEVGRGTTLFVVLPADIAAEQA